MTDFGNLKYSNACNDLWHILDEYDGCSLNELVMIVFLISKDHDLNFIQGKALLRNACIIYYIDNYE